MTGKLRFMLTLAILLVSVQPITLFAEDFRKWENAEGDYDGIPLRQGHHIEWFRSSDTDSDGNMCVVWSDTRLGDRDIWAQLIAPDGTHLWGEGGILVVQEYSRQEDPNVVADGNGNWIITWVDFRYDLAVEDLGDIFAQKLNSSGERQWPDSGVPLGVLDPPQLWVQGFADGNGGAVTIWVSGPAGQSDIRGQHINAAGEVQWGENGIVLAGGPSDQGNIVSSDYTADTDGNGGILFAWKDYTNPSDPNVRMNRVNTNGDLLWGDISGISICNDPSLQTRIRLAPDGEGGAFLVWQDSRNIDDSSDDLYGQHVDADGNISWTANGVPVVEAAGLQKSPRIVNSAVGEAIVVWEDRRANVESDDLYTQRISDNDGSIQYHWGEAGSEIEGMLLSEATLSQTDARLTPDGSGGAFYAWIDERFGASPDNDLYAQHVNADGERLWSEDGNGIAASDAPNAQNGSLVRVLGDNNVAVIWFDYRKGSPGLYYQRFQFDGTEIGGHNGEEIVYGLDADALSPFIVPSGEDYAIVAWSDGRYTELGTYAFAQKIDRETGDAQWAESGISLTPGYPYAEDDTSSIIFNELQVVPDGSDGVIAVWNDTRLGSNPYLFAQRIDSDGSPLWGDRGTAVSYAEGITTTDQVQQRLVPSGNGGVFVAYIEFTTLFVQRIKVQLLNSNGEPQWFEGDTPGIFITSGDVDHFIEEVQQFSDGTYLLVYRILNFFEDVEDLYAVRIDADGEMMWDEPLELCAAAHRQFNVVSTVVDNGIIALWEDERRGTPVVDIYGQYIHADGTVSWDEDGKAFSTNENQEYDISIISSPDHSDHFWTAWRDASDGDQYDLIMRYYDLDGEYEHSTQVGMDAHRQDEPVLQLDPDGGAYLAWEEQDRATYSDLLYTHLMTDGTVYNPQFLGEGEVLTEAYHRQQSVRMLDDGVDGYIAVWVDGRSTGKEPLSNVYMQRVDDPFAGVGEAADAQPHRWSLKPAYPNPFNPTTMIRYEVGHQAKVKLAIYDVLGREVARLVDEQVSAGQHQVMWNGRNSSNTPVATGTYFYRLEADGLSLTRRVVLMK